jgi:hypothetical protein
MLYSLGPCGPAAWCILLKYRFTRYTPWMKREQGCECDYRPQTGVALLASVSRHCEAMRGTSQNRFDIAQFPDKLSPQSGETRRGAG